MYHMTIKYKHLIKLSLKGSNTIMSNSTDFLAGIDAVSNEIDALEKEEAAIVLTIQPLLEPIHNKAKEKHIERELLVSEFFENAKLEDLFNAETAMRIYDLGWDHGRGNSSSHEYFKRVFKGTYIADYNWNIEDKSNTGVITPSVRIPKDYSLEVIQTTVEILEKIYAVNSEILNTNKTSHGVHFELHNVSGYYGPSKIFKDKAGWYLILEHITYMENAELDDIFINYSNHKSEEYY